MLAFYRKKSLKESVFDELLWSDYLNFPSFLSFIIICVLEDSYMSGMVYDASV